MSSLLDVESVWKAEGMEDSGLGLACGLVRHAGAVWLAADDPTGESLFLAAECFDLEGLFAETGVVPELADPGLGAAESLDRLRPGCGSRWFR